MVVVVGILTFAPINFLHPVRVVRLRPLNLSIFALWCVFGIIALLQDMQAQTVVKVGIGLSGIYLFCIGGFMQLFPKLGQKRS